MSPMNYYPKITLEDAAGNTFDFVSQLVTTALLLQLTLWIDRNGELYAKRIWPSFVPLKGQVQNFAEGFVANPDFQERFKVEQA